MNTAHRRLCSSDRWAQYLRQEVLEGLVKDVDLGRRMVEAGPGYGATTDWLRTRVDSLVTVETDPDRVAELNERFAGDNVAIVHGDAAELPYRSGSFDSAATCTMLHHVPTRRQQHDVISELVRVIRRGGVLVGSDNLASKGLRNFHRGDTYNPLPPDKLLSWLQRLGCRPVTLTLGEVMTFVATKGSRGR